jgi:hypothetical protein
MSESEELKIKDRLLTGTTIETFGKSVAMQLKALSTENALLAQSKIQNVLNIIRNADQKQRNTSQSELTSGSESSSSSLESNQYLDSYKEEPIEEYVVSIIE